MFSSKELPRPHKATVAMPVQSKLVDTSEKSDDESSVDDDPGPSSRKRVSHRSDFRSSRRTKVVPPVRDHDDIFSEPSYLRAERAAYDQKRGLEDVFAAGKLQSAGNEKLEVRADGSGRLSIVEKGKCSQYTKKQIMPKPDAIFAADGPADSARPPQPVIIGDMDLLSEPETMDQAFIDRAKFMTQTKDEEKKAAARPKLSVIKANQVSQKKSLKAPSKSDPTGAIAATKR